MVIIKCICIAINNVDCSVGWQAEDKVFHLSRSLKMLGKYVGRGKKNSIVSSVMSNPHLRSRVVTVMAKDVQKELQEICSDTCNSIL